ncbi:hypothetical protein ACIA58_31305 [Kribbella sp. NPDC051586]|uniref:hypothetical protein n=1 Tax=Kribbella sp. NPDC051586 TaxID=3364118 RepID=UPI0037A1FFB6
MTTLRQEIDRWEADLENIAEASQCNDWFLEERRLAEALHTIAAFRERIVPLLSTRQPRDSVLVAEIQQALDALEILRDDLYRTVHPPNSYLEVAEKVTALRALARVAASLDRTLEDAS